MVVRNKFKIKLLNKSMAKIHPIGKGPLEQYYEEGRYAIIPYTQRNQTDSLGIFFIYELDPEGHQFLKIVERSDISTLPRGVHFYPLTYFFHTRHVDLHKLVEMDCPNDRHALYALPRG